MLAQNSRTTAWRGGKRRHNAVALPGYMDQSPERYPAGSAPNRDPGTLKLAANHQRGFGTEVDT